MFNAPSATELSTLRPRRSFKLAIVTITALLLARMVFALSRWWVRVDEIWPWLVLYSAYVSVISAGFALWLIPRFEGRLAGRIRKIDVALVASIGVLGIIGFVAPELADPVVRDSCAFQHYTWHEEVTGHRSEVRPWAAFWFPLPIAAAALVFEWMRDDLRSYLALRK